MHRLRLIAWLLILALILGFGWYKSVENRRDRECQTAWRELIDRLDVEGRKEYDRVLALLKDIPLHPNARQYLEAELNDGRPFDIEADGTRQRAMWAKPEYGIHLELWFNDDKLEGHRTGWGTGGGVAVYPQPPQFSRTGPAESVRQFVSRWSWKLWLVALAAAVFSRPWGLIAAEAMLALALAAGTAWLVAPKYSLTVHGILSNNPLFFSAIMYLMSIVVLAFRLAPRLGPECRALRLQFSIRGLLILTAAVALLLGMGPFGYFALYVFGCGAVVFFLVLLGQ